MAPQRQDPREAVSRGYDAIIIGGGIYGITLALEAGLRGLQTLLLEKGDFGEYTSFNSLKILHGGLRYLQNLDLQRFKELVWERTWYLKTFPHHVLPLPCFMPLYGNGLKRPMVFRLALLANHLLSRHCNEDLPEERQLPRGKVVGVAESKTIFPGINPQGLHGGAVWHDAVMPNSQLLVMEMLRLAMTSGTTALNYTPVRTLLTDSHGKMKGVIALDRASGALHEYRATVVINSAGPWARKIVAGILGDKEELFRPMLAWNVAFNRPALSDHVLAVEGRSPGSRFHFVLPWKKKILAGCGHEPWLRGPDKPMPTERQLALYLDELNKVLPGVGLRREEITRVFAGLLPATAVGGSTLANREVIIDHGAVGGPEGLYSVSGVKFTTARLVADKIWQRLGTKIPALNLTRTPLPVQTESVYPPGENPGAQAREDASVHHLDDLVLRRSTLWEDGLAAPLDELAAAMTWDELRSQKEVERCTVRLQPLVLEPPAPPGKRRVLI